MTTQLSLQHRSGVLALWGAILAVLVVFISTPTALAAEKTGTLTVVKHEGEGELASITQPKPMQGVTFRINRLEGLDTQSQEELSRLVKKQPWLLTSEPGYPLGKALEVATDAAGQAQFKDISRGVYVVQEIPDYSRKARYSVVAPFLVAVPNERGDREVRVFAKNQSLVVTKSADIVETKAGELVTWRVRSQVPAPDSHGKLYQFVIRDSLDSHLELVGTPVVTIGGSQGSVRLNEGKDFTSDYGKSNRELELKFTDEGLRELAVRRGGHPETMVDVAIPTRVKSGTADATRIENTAHVYPEGYDPARNPGFATGGIESNDASVQLEEGHPTTDPGESPPPVVWPEVPPITAPDVKPCPNCKPCPECGMLPEQQRPGAMDRLINRITGHDSDDASQSSRPLQDRLAETGASVIGMIIAALALLGFGLWLIFWRRKMDTEDRPPVEVTEAEK